MAGRYQFSRPERRTAIDPWFRIGSLDIGSAALLALMCAVSVIVYAVEPVSKPILTSLALLPSKVLDGQLWRIFTWPLANGLNTQLFSAIISIALLWFVGNRLEQQVGRSKMAGFLTAIIILPALVAVGLDLAAAGIRPVQFAILLTFSAEYPNLKFFFGIPAWVFGVVYVGADILQLTGDRAGDQLALYLISLVIAALAARSIGLLEAYPWIPRVPIGGGAPKRPKQVRSATPKVVQGPWGGAAPTATADHAELDGLLDKISANGIDSLSKNEKQRLNELSKRLRGS